MNLEKKILFLGPSNSIIFTWLKNNGENIMPIFIEKMKSTLINKTIDNLDNYEKKQYKLYIFKDEEKFKRKIRLQIV